ncbi:hypothetical protein Pfo_011394 [Paulownia fortunei]|nr:hypothetical protein Pfo_011394 [Paulownia fortunei]
MDYIVRGFTENAALNQLEDLCATVKYEKLILVCVNKALLLIEKKTHYAFLIPPLLRKLRSQSRLLNNSWEHKTCTDRTPSELRSQNPSEHTQRIALTVLFGEKIIVGEMKRHQILQNLFGDQSDEEEVASSHDLNQHPNFLSVVHVTASYHPLV